MFSKTKNLIKLIIIITNFVDC